MYHTSTQLRPSRIGSRRRRRGCVENACGVQNSENPRIWCHGYQLQNRKNFFFFCFGGGRANPVVEDGHDPGLFGPCLPSRRAPSRIVIFVLTMGFPPRPTPLRTPPAPFPFPSRPAPRRAAPPDVRLPGRSKKSPRKKRSRERVGRANQSRFSSGSGSSSGSSSIDTFIYLLDVTLNVYLAPSFCC